MPEHKMKTYIALFRGINVGGRNLVSMQELVAIMEECGNENIQTCIQSGNVVFSGKSKSSDRIVNLIAERKGFRPELLVMDVEEFEQAIKNNPFESAEGKTCHFSFCRNRPETVDENRLNELKSETECFALVGQVFYLHAPDGIGRSRLAANVERCLGVSTTSRNLNTINRLEKMLHERK